MNRIVLAFSTALILACQTPVVSDAGTTDGGEAGDGGVTDVDAGLGPLTLQWELYAPTATKLIRSALVSNGTLIYSSDGPTLDVSTDLGRTWTARSTHTGQVALAGTSTVYVLEYFAKGLYRSDDSGQTFTPLTLPAAVNSDSNPLLSTTGDGDVWLYLQLPIPLLFRSADHGATFQQVPLPTGTTVLRICRSQGAFVAVRNAMQVVRFDGTQFVTLGTAPNPSNCFVTAAGTVLVNAYDITTFLFRLPANSSTPERLASVGATFYTQQGTELVRWLSSGVVDRSTDEGVTWTAQVTTTPGGFAVNNVVAAGTSLLTSSTSGFAELTAGATAWTVIEDPGLPPFLRVVDLSFARRTEARALLLDDNLLRTIFYSADGVTWIRGLSYTQAEARAIAVSPTGDRIFVGGSFGQWRMLNNSGKTELRTSQLGDGAGRTETNPIQQAVWDGDATGSVILVTTANDADSSGEVLSFNPEVALTYWNYRTPTSTTTSVSWRPGGYHALAISPSGGTLNRRVLTSFRTFISTNSWSHFLMTWNRALESEGFWQNAQPPINGSAGISAAYSLIDGGPVAMAFSEGRLQVGTIAFREVVTQGQAFNSARIVRFSSDGRMWFGGTGGLYRTVQPVTIR